MKINENLLSLESHMLLSIINLKLRDFYKNLECLCDDININQRQLEEKLYSIGYIYNINLNQFISKDA